MIVGDPFFTLEMLKLAKNWIAFSVIFLGKFNVTEVISCEQTSYGQG